MIRAVRTIVVKDLRERLRDRSFFLLGILTPLVLAFVLDLVFGGVGEGEIEVHLGVQDADGSATSEHLRDGILQLDGQGGIAVVAVPEAADPEDALDTNDLDAVAVIPAGFGADVSSSATPRLRLIEDPDRSIQAGVAGSIIDGLAAELQRTRLLAAAAARLGATPDLEAEQTDVRVNRDFPGGRGLNTSARLLAGMAIMFVFFTVSFGVTTLITERDTGTLTRLLAAPIPRDSILAAKALVSYVLGVLATLILMVAAVFLLGAEWGPWLGVVALVLAACLTAVALMAVVAGIARTAEGAGGAQAIIAVGLAMLGGSWFEVSGTGILGALARLTPHYWFLTGLEELASAQTWTVVGPSVAALAAIAVIGGLPAAVLLRRKLAP